LKKEKLQKAKDYAFNLLSYRDRSKYEIRERLKKKDYDDRIIEEVISKLVDLDYLDDRRFARKWVKERINRKPRGRYMLKYELKKKGIDNKIIANILNEMVNDQVEMDITERLAEKWLLKNHSKKDRNVKLKRYLHNKGITDYIINKYIHEK